LRLRDTIAMFRVVQKVKVKVPGSERKPYRLTNMMMAAGVPSFSVVTWKNAMLLATSAVCIAMVVLSGLAMESNSNDHVEYVLLWVNFLLTILGAAVCVHSNTRNAESCVVPLLFAWMLLGIYGFRYAVEHHTAMTDIVGIALILNFVCPSGLLLSWLLVLM
jgi:hypothetical protein